MSIICLFFKLLLLLKIYLNNYFIMNINDIAKSLLTLQLSNNNLFSVMFLISSYHCFLNYIKKYLFDFFNLYNVTNNKILFK
jgi:hypothetical protein